MPFHGIRRTAARRVLLGFLGAAAVSDVAFAAASLRFHGNGTGDVDRVKIPIDDPANDDPGPPADVGAGDFTLEFWMRASAADNTAGPVACGANADWIEGNVVADRDRFGQDRKFGVSIAGGAVVFGVSGDGTGDLTLCGSRGVLGGLWHHVAVQRRRSDGRMWLYVDGILDAEADGPDGDVSYPDDADPASVNDPFLVFGAEKHDAGPQFPSYDGFLDEIRISSALRYAGSFTRPRIPFTPDSATAALYRLDEFTGEIVGDSSGAPGGPSDGVLAFGGSPAGPEWSTDVAPLGGGAPLALTLVTGSLANPVQVTHAGDGSGRLFIVEQGGAIRIYDGGQLLATPFLDIGELTSDGSEQGLLSMAFHPDYATNGTFFVYYTDNIASPGDITLARYQVSGDPDVADEGSGEILLVVPHPVNSNHNGGQLAFSPVDGYLYMGTGDGGSGGDPPNNAQNLTQLLGKMLRIDVDASGWVPCGQSGAREFGVPLSNPFVGVPGCDEIWSYGLRNPFRFTFDRETGELFIGDVGQNDWEEVDYQPADSGGGENWGWRLMEGNHCFNPPSGCNDGSLELPIFEYDHGLGCSVSGGFRYRGSQIPELYGVYLYGDYCTGRLWQGVQEGNGTWIPGPLTDTALNVPGFGEDEAGEVYVVNHGGSVYRVTRAPNPVPATTTVAPGSVIAGDPGFTLTVNGSGFVYGSVVRWNGSDRPTTFLSSARVTAEIPASDILTAGQATVTVFSPLPGGGESGPETVNINPTFLDVPLSHFAYLYIQAVYGAGVTAGCGPRVYCPDAATTRAQMAVFLLRAREGPGYVPPPPSGTLFLDVPEDAFAAAWIEDLAGQGITGGCGGGNYCPDAAVTRAQMAVFLLKTVEGPAYVPPPCTGAVFDDVPCSGGIFDPWIEELASRGVTAGCGGGSYCPVSPVTRAQMAVLLVNGLDLPLP